MTEARDYKQRQDEAHDNPSTFPDQHCTANWRTQSDPLSGCWQARLHEELSEDTSSTSMTAFSMAAMRAASYHTAGHWDTLTLLAHAGTPKLPNSNRKLNTSGTQPMRCACHYSSWLLQVHQLPGSKPDNIDNMFLWSATIGTGTPSWWAGHCYL